MQIGRILYNIDFNIYDNYDNSANIWRKSLIFIFSFFIMFYL